MLMSAGGEFHSAWSGVHCIGNRSLLEKMKGLVVNSSQSRQPTGACPWVVRTLQAVEACKVCGQVLLTSVGLNTWELICWAAGHKGASQIVAVPDDGESSAGDLWEEIRRDFSLQPEKTCLLLCPTQPRRPKSFWGERDRKLFEEADTVLPVSVRPGGRIETLLNNSCLARNIDRSYRTDWEPGKGARTVLRFRCEDIRREVDPIAEGLLTHWTRASDGPWPGESRSEYYRSVVESLDEYPRSARRTWERIQSEKLLRASSWRIRGGGRVVSFTSLPPSRATAMMRWRKRYARYTVEPYGIALDAKVAETFGIRPVRYLDPGEPIQPQIPIHLIHSRGEVGEWPLEREFRHLSDLHLSQLPERSWRALDLTAFGVD